MTTVAVCDNVMAADTQGVFESVIMEMHKIFRVRDELIGTCGNFDNAVEFVRLYKKDKKIIRKNNSSDKNDNDFDYLLLNKKGLYLATGFYGPLVKVHEKFWAIGSGKEAAITAMRMGASAKEAVKMASLCDVYTGSKIQVRKL
jgi:ATP-dependent protease HslVU (ClpYQ) peptidase subunit